MINAVRHTEVSQSALDHGNGPRSPEFTIRWVLTHDPISLFEKAARHFARPW